MMTRKTFLRTTTAALGLGAMSHKIFGQETIKVVKQDYFGWRSAQPLPTITVSGISAQNLQQATTIRNLLSSRFRGLVYFTDGMFHASEGSFVSKVEDLMKTPEVNDVIKLMESWDAETAAKLLPEILFYLIQVFFRHRTLYVYYGLFN